MPINIPRIAEVIIGFYNFLNKCVYLSHITSVYILNYLLPICIMITFVAAIFKKAVWKRKHMTKLSFAWSKSLQNMTYYVDSWQAAGPYVNEHHWI